MIFVKMYFRIVQTAAIMILISLFIAGFAEAGSVGAKISGDGTGTVVEHMGIGDSYVEVHDSLSSTLTSPGKFSLSIENQSMKQSSGDVEVLADDYSLAITGKTTGRGKVTSAAGVVAGISINPNVTRGVAVLQSMVLAEAGKGGTAEGSASATGMSRAELSGDPFESGSNAVAAVKGATSAYGKVTSPRATFHSTALMQSSFEVVPGAGFEKATDSMLFAGLEANGKFVGSAEANGSVGADIHDWDTMHFLRAGTKGVAKVGGMNQKDSGPFTAVAVTSTHAEDSIAGDFTEIELKYEVITGDQGKWAFPARRTFYPSYELFACTDGSSIALVGTIDPETGDLKDQLSATDILGAATSTMKAPGKLQISDHSFAVGSISGSSTEEGITRYALSAGYGDVIVRIRKPPVEDT